MSLTVDSVTADNHQVLVNEHVEEVDVNIVDVNVGHLDIVELVDVELVVQVIGFINQGICESCGYVISNGLCSSSGDQAVEFDSP